MLADVAKLKGFNNFAAYLDPNAPPPQPDPLKAQELQIKSKMADAATANSQANNMKVQKTLVIDSQRMDNERHQLSMDAMDKDRTHNRQDLETAARIQTAQEELKLQEKEIAIAKQAAVSVPISPRP
jgi:hypothetical protein